MTTRPLAATLLLCGLLTGCAHTPAPPSKEKVTAALAKLHADPDKVYIEPFVAESPTTGQLSRQILLIVPAANKQTYQIIDSQGDIFDSYTDFLRNNTLPDQPGR